MAKPHWLEDIETDNCVISIYQCSCGFHLGLDATYIDQVAEIKIKCPSCKTVIDTGGIANEDN
jgi:hypothetical protein